MPNLTFSLEDYYLNFGEYPHNEKELYEFNSRNALTEAEYLDTLDDSDPKIIEKYYTISAEDGAHAAQLGSAEVYRYHEQYEQALQYALIEEQLGGKNCLMWIAKSYAKGLGCQADAENAFAYYKIAAEYA